MALFIKSVTIPPGHGWAKNALAYLDVTPNPRWPGATDSLTRARAGFSRGRLCLAWPDRNSGVRGFPANLPLAANDIVVLWQREHIAPYDWLVTGVVKVHSAALVGNPGNTGGYAHGLKVSYVCGPWGHGQVSFPRAAVANGPHSNLVSQGGAGKGGWITGATERAVRAAVRRGGCAHV